MKKVVTSRVALLALILAACSINVSDEQPTVTSQAAGNQSAAAPPWADLGLTGRLYYLAFMNERQTLLRLDLVTGRQEVIFSPPDNGWLTDMAVSPDGDQIVLAYSPPPPGAGGQFGFTDLYLMPADGSEEPRPLLQRSDPSETYFNVSWPAADTIYYAHSAPGADDLGSVVYTTQVERLPVPDGRPEVLTDQATWPRVSTDGRQLAYVTDSLDLVLAQADGSSPEVVLPADAFPAVDAPLFAPDGQTLYFSAVVAATAQSSAWPLLDWLLGVRPAFAHDVPSDWYSLGLNGRGGAPVRLTNMGEIGLYGDFSPDGRYLAFISSSGVQVMRPDGSGLFRLREAAATGTINWRP
jgi:Tol biopolymer transport system component